MYGYFRQNSGNTMSQLIELEAYGIEELFIEGSDMYDTDEFYRLQSEVTSGDTIVVPSFTSLGLTFEQLAPVIIEMNHKNIQLISVKEQLDTKEKPQFISHVKVLNDMNEAYWSAYKQTKKTQLQSTSYVTGRPSIAPEVIEEVEELYRQKYTLRMIANTCGISLGAVHKYVKQFREKEDRSMDSALSHRV